MKLPIRLTITTVFALYAVISISLVAGVNFYGGRDTILDAARKDIADSTKAAQTTIDRLIGQAFAASATVSRLPGEMFDWRAPEAILSAFTLGVRNAPQIYGIFVGFPDGAFVQAINLVGPGDVKRKVKGIPENAVIAWRVMEPVANGEHVATWRYFNPVGQEIVGPDIVGKEVSTYDPRTRPWFTRAMAERKPAISEVYVFSSLQKPGVTVSEVVRNAEGAVVGVDLSLSDLSAMAGRLRPGTNGAFAIVDSKSRVIAVSGAESNLVADVGGNSVALKTIGDMQDKRLGIAAKTGQNSEKPHVSFKTGGQNHLGYRRHASNAGLVEWDFLSVAVVEDFVGGLMSTVYRSLILAGIILVAAVTVVAVMSGWISRPIVRLRRMADQITGLNLSAVETFDSPFDEIKRLQGSMERMRGALDTFLRFVPRDVVRELVGTDETVKIGGVRREVTLLFTDVEGFTSLAERMTPEEVLEQTCDYFEQLSFAIQANRGTIDKFIGDAIMALWNAPNEDPMQADNACRATLTAYHISNDLNAEFAAAGKPLMRTRFGLHTAEVLVGNMGARDRMQYTCLGAGVNLAARIEGLNKFYGTQILVSDTVRRRASKDYVFRRIDIVEAKGTTIPLTIYELMGESDAESPFYVGADTLRCAVKYEQAFDFYLHRDFQDSLAVLEALQTEAPDDPVVTQLAEKCRGLIADPPPAAWNGVTTLDEK